MKSLSASKHNYDIIKIYCTIYSKVKEGKAIPVTGREGP
jgi:hypothetical protein